MNISWSELCETPWDVVITDLALMDLEAQTKADKQKGDPEHQKLLKQKKHANARRR